MPVIFPPLNTQPEKSRIFSKLLNQPLPLILERNQILNEVLKTKQIIKSKRQSSSQKKIITLVNFENIEETQAVRSFQKQSTLIYKKANSSKSKTAYIST